MCLLLSRMLIFAVKTVFAAVLFLLLTLAKQVVRIGPVMGTLESPQ